LKELRDQKDEKIRTPSEMEHDINLNFRLMKSMHPLRDTKTLYSYIQMINDYSDPKLSRYFIEVLASARSRQAMDERDKIFGLLGLFPPTWAKQVHVSYTSDFHIVFRETAYQV
jgi:hypothetical protein